MICLECLAHRIFFFHLQRASVAFLCVASKWLDAADRYTEANDTMK